MKAAASTRANWLVISRLMAHIRDNSRLEPCGRNDFKCPLFGCFDTLLLGKSWVLFASSALGVRARPDGGSTKKWYFPRK